MRGLGTLDPLHRDNKWNIINRFLLDSRTNILALQETHLSQERLDRIATLYGKRMQIFSSADPSNPSNTAGVATILNCDHTNVASVTSDVIIPGRALLVTVPWHNDKVIRILNVYAPNEMGRNADFWKSIRETWARKRLHHPDVMVGDFNCVEEALDRRPCRRDARKTVIELDSLKQFFHHVDGWRTTYPEGCAYTWHGKHGPSVLASRIDRIYLSDGMLVSSSGWNISPAPFRTDHSMVSVVLSDLKAPFVGPGRWQFPPCLLDDQKFIQDARSMVVELERAILNNAPIRSADANPQSLFETFKRSLSKNARTRARQIVPKLKVQIITLKDELHALQTRTSRNTVPLHNVAAESSALHDRISELESSRYTSLRLHTTARFRANGESPNGYWPGVLAERKPRDLVYSLIDPNSNPEHVTHRSDEMAKLARDYHDHIQSVDLDKDLHLRRDAIHTSLAAIPDDHKHLQDPDINTPLTPAETRHALSTMETGKATGLNGIPYELWQKLDRIFTKLPDGPHKKGDIITSLTTVFNDIAEHGVIESTSFTDGWMCPLYKKGDRRAIANYRPITLLNTDYKVMTKALTLKLAPLAKRAIHHNQAGFVPGRQIFDEVRLAELMSAYAEATEENGMIIALDQEKAYDKVEHEYLWTTLATFGVNGRFLRTIQALYRSARTQVIINGEISSPFLVTRGVRQGDPLSCLLFIFAIEPLACLLRGSALHGFHVPGTAERLVTNLFADDTSAYLSEHDDFATLQSTLDLWCLASRARFNIPKTFVIPIGTKHYRTQLLATRRPSQDAPPLPPEITLVPDGTATRLLGAWIGNGADQPTIWTPTVDKIAHALNFWLSRGPTLKGKSLISKFVLGGMTQYLTKVQGMPSQVEKRLNAILKKFVWGPAGGPPTVRKEVLSLPWARGGISLLDLPARNRAIEATWLRSYLAPNASRPTWAFVADALTALDVPKKWGHVERGVLTNSFLQAWHPRQKAPSRLPSCLTCLLEAARAMRVSLPAHNLSPHVKRQLPAWYHVSDANPIRKLNNTPASKCLRRAHGARTISDLVKISRRVRAPRHGEQHSGRDNCPCPPCKRDRRRYSCQHPGKCSSLALELLSALPETWNPLHRAPTDGLTLTAYRRSANAIAQNENGDILFNPSMSASNDISDCFRIFTDPDSDPTVPARRSTLGLTLHGESTTVFVAGAIVDNDMASPTTGAGVWFGPLDPRNLALRTVDPYESEIAAGLAAVIVAAILVPDFAPLHLVSPHPRIVTGLTSSLNRHEDAGWIDIADTTPFRAASYHLRRRSAPTTLRLSTSSTETNGPLEARLLAATGARRPPTYELPSAIPRHFLVSGARLSSLTQALAYRGVLASRPITPRRSTQINLAIVRHHIRACTDRTPSDKDIWLGCHDAAISRNISDFLWKGLHNAHKCGPYWNKITNFEHRADCRSCDVPETLEHILTECSSSGQSEVWQLTRTLWLQKHHDWSPPSMGGILGCGSTSIRDINGIPKPGRTRLWKILVSESAFLIWKTRNRQLFDPSPCPAALLPALVRGAWIQALDHRLALDQTLTKASFKHRKLDKNLVLETWSGVLNEDRALPDDWIGLPGVLVGRPPLPAIPAG